MCKIYDDNSMEDMSKHIILNKGLKWKDGEWKDVGILIFQSFNI